MMRRYLMVPMVLLACGGDPGDEGFTGDQAASESVGTAEQAQSSSEPCENVCRHGVSCNQHCAMPNPAPGWDPTCGDAGFPCGCPQVWREVSRQPIGITRSCSIFSAGLWCNATVRYAVVEVNDICGFQQRTRCVQEHVSGPRWAVPESQGAQSCF